MTERETALLKDLAAVLKKHGVKFEKGACYDSRTYFKSWIIEGEDIGIELEDAMDAIEAINEVPR